MPPGIVRHRRAGQSTLMSGTVLLTYRLTPAAKTRLSKIGVAWENENPESSTCRVETHHHTVDNRRSPHEVYAKQKGAGLYAPMHSHPPPQEGNPAPPRHP